MIDTDFKIESWEQFYELLYDAVDDRVFKCFKEAGFVPESKNQSFLIPKEVRLNRGWFDYMQDKQCLVWLKSSDEGKQYGIACDQVYISKRGSVKVEKVLPFSFEEVFHIWECFYQGRTPEDIYSLSTFDKEDAGLSKVKLVIWALQNGRFNHVLEFIHESRYTFDFKKYAGSF